MTEIAYLWEKTMVAVSCLAGGNYSFEKRLYYAYVSALLRLQADDAPADLKDDLKWILDLCARHMDKESQTMAPIGELEQKDIVDKLVHLLIQNINSEEAVNEPPPSRLSKAA